MSPPNEQAEKKNRGSLWGWLFILLSPILLVLLAFVLLRNSSPSPGVLSWNMVAALFIALLGISILGFIGWFIRSETKRISQESIQRYEAMREFVPEAFTTEQLDLMQIFMPRQRSHVSEFTRFILFLGTVAILFWFIDPSLVLSDFPLGIAAFGALIILYAVWDIVGNLIDHARKHGKPIPWRTIVTTISGSIIILALFFVFAFWLNQFTRQPNSGIVIIILVCVGITLVLLPVWWDLVITEYVRRPLRQLNYDQALRRATQVHRWIRSTTWKSIVLLYMGRADEAETAIRQSIKYRKSLLIADSFLGWLEENLGYVLMEQHRYDEAIKAFKAGIAITPKDSDRTNGLAEVYLRQGIEPQRALELTEQSIANNQPGIVNRFFMRNSTGELRANRAWALALAGRYEGARESLAQAFREYDKHSKLSAASMYWRAGQVMHLRGDERAAREYFAKVLEIDRHGNYGRLARQALRM